MARSRRFLFVLPALAATAFTVPMLGSAATAAPSDPLYGRQWGLAQVGAPAAWTRSTGSGALIGVVDTGIDLNHEDPAGKVAASTACVGTHGDASACSANPSDAQDVDGHGTHVSA